MEVSTLEKLIHTFFSFSFLFFTFERLVVLKRFYCVVFKMSQKAYLSPFTNLELQKKR